MKKDNKKMIRNITIVSVVIILILIYLFSPQLQSVITNTSQLTSGGGGYGGG